MKVLDLFCGMGGWSIGFHREGFDCYGLDISDVGYPYEFWHTPIEELRGGEYRDMGFDVIVASPPCTEFSYLRNLDKTRRPANPEKGMTLVKEAKRVIELVQPRFWVIENVAGARKHFYPLLGSPVAKIAPFYLWGNFPKFMLSSSNRITHKVKARPQGLPEGPRWSPVEGWLRARIPLPLSQPLAHACKTAILGGKSES